jgi:hypothetical protein
MIPWFYLPYYEGIEAYDGNKKWTYLCVCVCVPKVPVCGMSGREMSLISNEQLDEANKRRSGNALSTKDDP